MHHMKKNQHAPFFSLVFFPFFSFFGPMLPDSYSLSAAKRKQVRELHWEETNRKANRRSKRYYIYMLIK